MTREEAIKYLIKPVVTSTEIGEIKAKELEAYDMAIEALSALPMSDLISRAKMKEALYEIVAKSTPHLLLSKDPNNGKIYATDVLRAIDHLPSATEIKKKQIEVGAVADGIYGAETSDKRIKALLALPSANYITEKPNNAIKPSNDVISRADAIEEISKGVWNVYELIDRINALPSADRPTKIIAEIKVDTEEIVKRIKEEYEITDRPQGEWIFKTNDESVCEEWECSKCGNWSFVKTSYCPNCGAEMKKEE